MHAARQRDKQLIEELRGGRDAARLQLHLIHEVGLAHQAGHADASSGALAAKEGVDLRASGPSQAVGWDVTDDAVHHRSGGQDQVGQQGRVASVGEVVAQVGPLASPCDGTTSKGGFCPMKQKSFMGQRFISWC